MKRVAQVLGLGLLLALLPAPAGVAQQVDSHADGLVSCSAPAARTPLARLRQARVQRLCGTPKAVAVADRGSATSYALHRNSNGTVTRWNPCDGPITVRVNAPAAALADVLAALEQARVATGLDLVYTGTTAFIPQDGATQPADLVVAWATRAQSDLWSPGAIGVGGWSSTGTSTDGTRWNWRISSGFVIVDPDAGVVPGFGRGATRGALLLHEIAHALGLSHVNDVLQVMNPVLASSAYGSYGTGDLAGLRAVGATQGCTTAA